MVVDLGEFVYARKGFATIPEYLKTVPNHVNQVVILWKFVGSNGQLTHPASAIITYTQRAHYIPIEKENLSLAIGGGSFKTISRGSQIKKLHHISELNQEHHCVHPTTNFTRIEKPWFYFSFVEETLENHVLHLNHYRVQSRQFVEAKIKRGSAALKSNTNFRTEE